MTCCLRLLCSSLLILVACGNDDARTNTVTFHWAASCAPETWEAIANIYASALADPEGFPDAVTENSAAFSNVVGFHRCFTRFADALPDVPHPPRGEIEQATIGIATDAAVAAGKSALEVDTFMTNPVPRLLRVLFGLPYLGVTAADTVETKMDPSILRTHLHELARSVVSIQAGQVDAYFNTAVYRVATTLWSEAGSVVSPNEIQTLRRLTFELSHWYLLTLGQALS